MQVLSIATCLAAADLGFIKVNNVMYGIPCSRTLANPWLMAQQVMGLMIMLFFDRSVWVRVVGLIGTTHWQSSRWLRWSVAKSEYIFYDS